MAETAADRCTAPAMQWIDPSKLAELPRKQTTEVVTHRRWVLATLLKQEPGHARRLREQAVFIPLGMFLNEYTHGVMQILRQLIFHTNPEGHRIRGLAQLRPSAVNQPSGHANRRPVKKADSCLGESR